MTKFYYERMRLSKLHVCMKSFVLMLFSIFGMTLSQAQVSSYVFSQSNGSYTEITGGTVLATATGNAIGAPSLDSGVFPVTLPFPFTFNNQSYNDISVSVNGYIVFGGTAPTSSTPISGTTVYDGAVAAFGRDINSVFDIAGKTGSLSWEVSGTAPNRVATIQWKEFRPTYSTSTTSAYTFNFQIKLYETSNVVSTVYSAGGYLVGSTSYSSTVQIGLRGLTNADFNNRVNASTALFTSSTAGTANNSSQSFNTTVSPPGMPTEGLIYTWTPPTCYGPNAPFNYTATTNTATVSWTAANPAPALGYEVYYSTTNVAPDSSTILDATNSVSTVAGDTDADIAGLTPATTYYVWVRSKCSTTDHSTWAPAITFITDCTAITSMFEDFESYATGSIVPTCWARIEGTGSQTITTTTPASGVRNIYQYATATQTPDIVVLPTFSNINSGTHRLRFKARVSTTPGSLDVGYVTNISDASTFTVIQNLTITNTTYTTSDAEYFVYVPTTVPANARLAIRNGLDSKSYYWDDVYWEVTPTCVQPTNFAITGQTANSISMQWSAPATTTPLTYTIYYSTTNTAPDGTTVLDGTNSLTVPASATTATISPLNPSTTYYFWIRSNCSATDQSIWSSNISGYTGYCIPATGATITRWLETVSTTGGMTNLNYSNATYIAYDDQSSTTFSTYPSGTINYSMDASTTSNTYYYIWVDWNNDLDFNDAGEKVLGSASVATATGALSVPSTTPLGSYRVRLAAATASTIGACGTPANGNYVDFTLNIVAPPSCVTPTSFAVTGFTDTNANFSWTPSITPPNNGYEYYYSTTNSAPTAAVPASGIFTGGSAATSGIIPGLTPSTTYYVWIRSACSGTDYSVWTGPVTFTTACPSVAAPFTESFSSGTLPSCWKSLNPTTSSTSANVFWKFGTGIDYGATNNGKTAGTYAWVDASSPYDNEHTVQLYSPLINLTGLAAPAVQFEWYKNHLTSATGTLPAYDNNKLIVEINSGSGWVTIFADSSNASNLRIIPIPLGASYVNTTIQLRFTVDKDVAGNGYFYDDMLIDEVKVLEASNLGTSDTISDAKEFRVYPNPFTDFITISDARDVTKVTVIDVSGRLVRMIDNPSSKINLSELKSGMYILKVDYKDGSSKSAKVIKK